MKLLRPLLVGLAVIAAVTLCALVLAYTAVFQTWAARRALNSQTDIRGEVRSISVSFGEIEIENLRLNGDGYRLTLPSARVEVPVIAAARSNVAIKRLVAKGWTLDLTVTQGKLAGQLQAAPALAGYLALFAAAAGAETALPPLSPDGFSGIFDQLGLPFDLSVEAAELEGEVIFPRGPGKAPGRARLLLTGGGLHAGGEGKFTLVSTVAVDDPEARVNQLDTRSELTAHMDSPRSFDRIDATVVATASGPQAPNGARLTFDLDARRDASGEAYGLVLRSAVRTLAEFDGVFRAGAAALSGNWNVDTQSSDLSPFTLGQPLPAFNVSGKGTYLLDRRFAELQATGSLQATADRLEVIAPQLASVGLVRLDAEFDVTGLGPTVHVKRLVVNLAGEAPVARLEALQGLEWDRRSGELRVAAPDEELLRVALQGLPLGWLQPFVEGFSLSGSPVRGEFRATAREGRFSLRTATPLTVQSLAVSQPGRPLVNEVDLRLVGSADYATQGWQAELSELSARGGAGVLFSLRSRVGQTMGRDQPIKATGDLQLNGAAIMAQPIAAAYAPLTAGDAKVDFTLQLSDRKEIGLTFDLTGLLAGEEVLPSFKGELRADMHADGRIDAKLPLVVKKEERESDLELVAAIKPVAGTQEITAQISSRVLHVQDVQILAGLASSSSPARPPVGAVPSEPQVPIWQGYGGRVRLDLKRLIYAPNMEALDVVGTIRLGPSALVAEDVSAVLSDGGLFKLGAQISHDAFNPDAYALTADMAVNGFDPAPMLRSVNPMVAPPVEGKFDLTTHLAGRARTVDGLAQTVTGQMSLTSRGGTLRALSVDITDYARAGTRLASVAGLIGLATGDERVLKYSERLKAASELTTDLSAVNFDQLTVQVERSPENHYVIKDLAIISPTMRLLGNGIIEYQPGVSVWSQPLSLRLQLGARDSLAGHLRVLKLLAERPDPLGYSPLVESLELDGSLDNIGTSRFRDLLVQALNGT